MSATFIILVIHNCCVTKPGLLQCIKKCIIFYNSQKKKKKIPGAYFKKWPTWSMMSLLSTWSGNLLALGLMHLTKCGPAANIFSINTARECCTQHRLYWTQSQAWSYSVKTSLAGTALYLELRAYRLLPGRVEVVIYKVYHLAKSKRTKQSQIILYYFSD